MTALTIYTTDTAATTVSTADKLQASAPSSSTSKTTKTGKLLAWGELYAQGSTGTWPAGVSAPAPSGHGFLLDDTSLEIQQLASGTYTPSVKLSTSSGTVTAVIHVRLYKRSSVGVYTLIADCASASTALTLTAAVINSGWSGNTGIGAVNFAAGDKLYIDMLLDITANTSSSTTATTSLFKNDGANDAVATPGYSSLAVSLAGSVAATATVNAAALGVGRRLVGSATATASLPAAALTVTRRLAGSASASGSLAGHLAVKRLLAGSASATASLAGTLAYLRPLAGVVSAAASFPAASLTVTRRLAGSASATASLAGSLTVDPPGGGPVALAGRVSATAALAAASLTVSRQLAGSATATASWRDARLLYGLPLKQTRYVTGAARRMTPVTSSPAPTAIGRAQKTFTATGTTGS